MSVPKLDLAPKLKRPLSLWNPLDYLRLLYWVFYFPQALRWYVDTFGGGYIEPTLLNWGKRWQLRLKNPIQRNLQIQELILIVFIPLMLYGFFLFDSNLREFAVFLIVGSIIFGLLLNLIWDIGLGIAGSIVFGVAFGVVYGVVYGVVHNVVFDVASSVAYGVVYGVASSVVSSVVYGVAYGVAYGVVYGVVSSVVSGVAYGVAYGVVYGVAYGVTLVVILLRLENWLINIVFNLTRSRSTVEQIAHVTLLPDYFLIDKLQQSLQQDWSIGISNVNQILKYTLQLAHVVPPIKRVLLKLPGEQVIYRVNQLVEGTNNWKLIRSLVKFNSKIPSFATTNGFWYLHEKQPNKATEAFTVVRDLLYGEEVFILAQTLTMFQQAKTANTIANLTIPNLFTKNLLRPTTWQVMNSLKRVVEDIKLIKHSASRNTKSFAYSRAIGELTEVIDNKNNIPEAERELIVDIAQTWKQSLERIGKDIGNVTITQPVRNPYVIGNPVTGSLFVGREDILRQLEELWITGNQLQSVVLFGHRRMGKTSILKNVANATGAEIKVIYVNLQELGEVDQGVAEVLMAISDEIASSLSIKSPDDNDFLQLPQRTFKRYLKQVVATMTYQGLIIALDEFETIEELIQKEQIAPAFMGYLRSLVQMQPDKIAFAFAGLHTLEEMTANYFEPFFASVIPIRVSFLNSGATKTILANPVAIEEIEKQNSKNNEFLLDYTGEALDLIYSLTAGQPYLVQLIGFQLVRNYNDRVFEQGKAQDNTFTLKDIEAVINPKFFQQGRYYFEGVWGQAAQDAPGQQEIIKALAPYPQGLTRENLAFETGLDGEIIEKAIAILIRHDVIQEEKAYYRIIVELFRRWVLMKTD